MHDFPAQKTSHDDSDSHFADEQCPSDRDISLQPVDTVPTPEAGRYPQSVSEQHSNADCRSSQMSPTEEAKSVTPDLQDIAQYESDDAVQLSRTPEIAYSSQFVSLDACFAEDQSEESRQPAFRVPKPRFDSAVDSEPVTQQMPETRRLFVVEESKGEVGVNEKHTVSYQGDEHGYLQAALQEKLEEQPAELAFSETVLAAGVPAAELARECIDDETSAVSSAVRSDEQRLEHQPVSLLPVLSDVALTALVDTVPQRTVHVARADVAAAATSVVSCMQSAVYEMPAEEFAAHDLEVPGPDAAHAVMSECGQFAEATTTQPESECRVQQLTIPDLFGELVVHLRSPETVTCYGVEVPSDLLLAVESGERELGVDTSAKEEMSIAGDNLSLTAKMPAVPTQQEESVVVEPDTAVHYEAAYLPETSDSAEQSTVETYAESEEVLRAHSLPRCEADLPTIWKYRHEVQIGGLDPGGKMPGLEPRYRDSFGNEYSIRCLMEDVAEKSPFDFADVEVEYDYPRSNDDDEEETGSATSEEWCVMEKERDLRLDMTLTEEVTTQAHEHDVEEISQRAEKPVYVSPAQETSPEYCTKPASCTSIFCL